MSLQSQVRLMRKRVLIPAPQFNTQQKAFTPILTMTDGSSFSSYSPGGGDIKGATDAATGDTGTPQNNDQNSAPVNDDLIVNSQAQSVVTAADGFGTPDAQPDVARNVVITIENGTGGSLDLFEGTTTYTVTGTFRGSAQAEVISLTSSSGNKAVAAGKFRFVAGVEPFDTVTSITTQDAEDHAATLSLSAGPGTRLGLPLDTDTGVGNNDVTKITVDAAALTIAGATDDTNKTINVGTIANGADVGIVYKIDYDGAAGTIAALAAETLIVSPGSGNAILKDINSSGKMGFLVVNSNLCMCHIDLADVDRNHPIYMRNRYVTGSSTTSDTVSWINLFMARILGTTAVAIPATALNTIITLLTADSGVANAEQATAWGVIKAGTLGATVESLDVSIERDASAGISEDVHLTGLEVEYTPRITRVSQPLEGEAWTAD